MLVKDSIHAVREQFTPTDERIATHLLDNYPRNGLIGIQELAQNCNVSLPSVTRFVTKLGYDKYSDFFQSLLDEFKEQPASPLDLKLTTGDSTTANNFFAEYSDRCIKTVEKTKMLVSEQQFQRVCEKIQNPKSAIYIIGGRFGDGIAQILSSELRQLRADVYHIPQNAELWPEYILRMRKNDVFVVVDFRRHSDVLYNLTKTVRDKVKPTIIVVSDESNAPICQLARETVVTANDTQTPWDSYASALTLFQAMAYQIADQNWDNAQQRMLNWDTCRDGIREHS